MEKIISTDVPDKLMKSVEDLAKEGWKDTYATFANLKVFKRNNDEIVYNPDTHLIEHIHYANGKQ